MEDEIHTKPPDEVHTDESPSDEQPVDRLYRRVEALSAAILALATIATAWSGYQSSRWSGEQARHRGQAFTAIIRIAKFTKLVEEKMSLHTNLFVQWAAAVSTNNTALADFLFDRFPEPLKSATVAWRATQPLTNPAAPKTPFDMPNYALAESVEVERWEATATAESEAADRADEISDRYLLFTILFASVLFFGGISGKFRWLAVDVAVLVFGALILLAGVVILITAPTQ